MKPQLNVPNLITALRIICTIPLAYFIIVGNSFWALVVFGIGLLSDADGAVAWLLKQETAFGEVFDFIADTIFIVGGLLALLIMDKVSLLLIVVLLLVNVPRFVLVNKTVKKSGSTGSTMPSKISGMLSFFIIPLAIVDFSYLNEFIMFVIVFTAAVIGKKYFE